ncbi:hypothetical protein ACWFRM_18525 [Streptomyces sp. NPDC055144]
MLPRMAYLAAPNTLALLRLLSMQFTDTFNAVPADAELQVVSNGIQMPRMNSITERRIQTFRRDLLDRTLVWNDSHLLHVVREFEVHDNRHKPHQALHQAARTDPRATAYLAPGDPPTRPTRRSPSRVPTCSLSWANELSTPADPVPVHVHDFAGPQFGNIATRVRSAR